MLYGSATELRAALDYDFSEEKKFSYKNLSMDESIHHLAVFVSRLWQIHVFGEGNTRTTAVFFIKLLGLKPTRSSALLHEMAEYGIIEPVSGHGKGKYRFW